MLMVCKLNIKHIIVNISLPNLLSILHKLSFIKNIIVNILLGNCRPFFEFLISKWIIKHLKDFFSVGFILANYCIKIFIKALGLINALYFSLAALSFVIYLIIRTLIILTCFIWIIVYYLDGDVSKYDLFFCGMICILIGLSCLLVSIKLLVYGLDAYVKEDYLLVLFFIVLAFLAFSTGLYMIKYGLHLSIKQYLILTCSPSPKVPRSDSGSKGSGSGSGGGNGNGNGGTNTDGTAGGHQADKDEQYKRRRLAYLESEENKYERTLNKASVEYTRLRKKKARWAKKGKIDATFDQQMSTMKNIKDGSRFRLYVTRGWIKAHKDNKPYVSLNKKEFIINQKSPFTLKLEKKPDTS